MQAYVYMYNPWSSALLISPTPNSFNELSLYVYIIHIGLITTTIIIIVGL